MNTRQQLLSDPNTVDVNRGRFDITSSKWKPTPFDVWFQVKINTIRMAERMGYIVPQHEKEYLWTDYLTQYIGARTKFIHVCETISRSEKSSLRQAMRQVYTKANDPSDKIFFDFITPASKKNIAKDDMTTHVARMEQRRKIEGVVKFTTTYLIIAVNIAPQAAKELMALEDPSIVIIPDSNMIAEAQECIYSPIYFMMSLEQTKEFFQSNGLSASSMKSMAKNDPIAIRNGWKPGTLVQIVTHDDWSNNSVSMGVSYRYVTEIMIEEKDKVKK
jgi:hypothetical protein